MDPSDGVHELITVPDQKVPLELLSHARAVAVFPRVINAALTLVNDKDDEVRRTAIEILNQTKDSRALNYLIEATKDKDWWVSERAVDALQGGGSLRSTVVVGLDAPAA